MKEMDLSHIHEKFRHVAGLPDDERIRFLYEPRWIGYPRATEIIGRMRALLEMPSRPRMPNLLIVGEPNNGKTTLVRRFLEVHGRSHVDEEQGEPHIPVVLAEAPPKPDEKGLYVSVLERFATPYRATDPAPKMRYQLIHLMRYCHVRMLVIDEFHSLLTGTPVKQREVMNAIKLLCNELGIPIVGVGTAEAVRVLHSDPQHASRFDVVRLGLWELDRDFIRLLVSFERILPLRRPSGLNRPELARPLHSISGGNLGDLHRLLIECAVEAIRGGGERITPEIVEAKSWVKPTRGIREVAR